ncbi:MAG: hypothetical protein NVV63_12535 [Opitutus sp.]|nr:hypothetical protein [Opitutus sp.]
MNESTSSIQPSDTPEPASAITPADAAPPPQRERIYLGDTFIIEKTVVVGAHTLGAGTEYIAHPGGWEGRYKLVRSSIHDDGGLSPLFLEFNEQVLQDMLEHIEGGAIKRRPLLWNKLTNRRLICVRTHTLPGGYAYERGAVLYYSPSICGYYYGVTGASGIAPGTTVGLDQVRRRLAAHFEQLPDDGSIPEHLADIEIPRHFLTPEVELTASLILGVERAPNSPFTQAMLRNIGCPLSPEELSVEALHKWHESLSRIPPVERVDEELLNSTRDLPCEVIVSDRSVEPPTRKTVAVYAELRRTTSGTVSWNRIESFSGNVDVPVDVVRQGEAAIEEFIQGAIDDLGDCDSDSGEEPDWNTSSTTESVVKITNDIDFDDIESDAMEDYPEEFEE